MPNGTTFQYLVGLRPAIPLSRVPNKDGSHKQMSNQELMRFINEGAVLINGEKWSAKEILDVPVYSLVFWPKSQKNRTTLV